MNTTLNKRVKDRRPQWQERDPKQVKFLRSLLFIAKTGVPVIQEVNQNELFVTDDAPFDYGWQQYFIGEDRTISVDFNPGSFGKPELIT